MVDFGQGSKLLLESIERARLRVPERFEGENAPVAAIANPIHHARGALAKWLEDLEHVWQLQLGRSHNAPVDGLLVAQCRGQRVHVEVGGERVVHIVPRPQCSTLWSATCTTCISTWRTHACAMLCLSSGKHGRLR